MMKIAFPYIAYTFYYMYDAFAFALEYLDLVYCKFDKLLNYPFESNGEKWQGKYK